MSKSSQYGYTNGARKYRHASKERNPVYDRNGSPKHDLGAIDNSGSRFVIIHDLPAEQCVKGQIGIDHKAWLGIVLFNLNSELRRQLRRELPDMGPGKRRKCDEGDDGDSARFKAENLFRVESRRQRGKRQAHNLPGS